MDKILVKVFPLPDVVLYPHASVPLNIFEPRYIKMIRDAINTHTPIGLLLTNFLENEQFILKSNSGDFKEHLIGFGHPQIIQENSDGSMFIMLRGIGKARLIERQEEKAYRVYSAEVIAEVESLEAGNIFRLNRLKIMLKEWLDNNIKSKEDRDTFFKKISEAKDLIAYASHFLVEDPKMKQAILEINDINQKLDLILSLPKNKVEADGKILAIS